MARGGGLHGRAPCHARSCVTWPATGLLAFVRDFSFSDGFDGFCPLNYNVSGFIQQPIHPIHSPFISISIRVFFRKRKRERRRTVRILDRVLRLKDGSTRLDEQNLVLLLSFPALILYFVIFL